MVGSFRVSSGFKMCGPGVYVDGPKHAYRSKSSTWVWGVNGGHYPHGAFGGFLG